MGEEPPGEQRVLAPRDEVPRQARPRTPAPTTEAFRWHWGAFPDLFLLSANFNHTQCFSLHVGAKPRLPFLLLKFIFLHFLSFPYPLSSFPLLSKLASFLSWSRQGRSDPRHRRPPPPPPGLGDGEADHSAAVSVSDSLLPASQECGSYALGVQSQPWPRVSRSPCASSWRRRCWRRARRSWKDLRSASRRASSSVLSQSPTP
nr:uncharacterized protein LOC113828087 [Penaeus vannamei]